MAAYVIARVTVHDMDRYKDYAARSTEAVAAFGGRFLVRGGEKETLEGEATPERMVVVEFDDMATARAWWQSEQYQQARAIRTPVSVGHFTLVDGV